MGYVECFTELEGTKEPTNYFRICLFFYTLFTRSLEPIRYKGDTDIFSVFLDGRVIFLFLFPELLLLLLLLVLSF